MKSQLVWSVSCPVRGGFCRIELTLRRDLPETETDNADLDTKAISFCVWLTRIQLWWKLNKSTRKKTKVPESQMQCKSPGLKQLSPLSIRRGYFYDVTSLQRTWNFWYNKTSPSGHITLWLSLQDYTPWDMYIFLWYDSSAWWMNGAQRSKRMWSFLL